MYTNLSRWSWIVGGASLLVCCAVSYGAAAEPRLDCPLPANEFKPDPKFSSEFLIERCRFHDTGRNKYFRLQPGFRIVLESDEELQQITVLDETRLVDGVLTRVVEELEFEKDGEELIKVERSLNFFAICQPSNDVYYFGEEVEDFDENGNVISHEGAWLAGRNGARAGVIMPGTILVGGGFYQEIAPEDEALDKGRVRSITNGCEAGEFEFERVCVTIKDGSDCSTDADTKLYAAGVGVIKDEDLEVASFGFVD